MWIKKAAIIIAALAAVYAAVIAVCNIALERMDKTGP